MRKDSRIFVAGHKGLVGSSIVRLLKSKGYTKIITRSKDELDLRNQIRTEDFFLRENPEYVFLAAATVGGIHANEEFQADFIRDNLQIQTNFIHFSYMTGVKKLLFLGSSCVYPKLCPQPIKEEYFMTSPLEPTNEAYAIAKIAGIQMIKSYRKQYELNGICVMPNNVYGPGDKYDEEKGHVLAALLMKFHKAKENDDKTVTIWGTGNPKREFLYVNDLAHALYFLMINYDSPDIINIGSGCETSIMDLAHLIAKIVGFKGKIETDLSKPDGTPRKLVDTTKLTRLGWQADTSLDEGLKLTYKDYLKTH